MKKIIIITGIVFFANLLFVNYSFATLDAWKTSCKAKSFEFAVRNNGKSDIVRVGLPHAGTTQKKSNDIWS